MHKNDVQKAHSLLGTLSSLEIAQGQLRKASAMTLIVVAADSTFSVTVEVAKHSLSEVLAKEVEAIKQQLKTLGVDI